MELRAEVNSPFNTPQFENPRTDMSNPSTFGTIAGAGGARSMQVGAKVRF